MKRSRASRRREDKFVAQVVNLRFFLWLHRFGVQMKRPPTLDRLGYKSFYRRNLPHIQPLNSALFVTFRLTGSLPEEVFTRMAEERRQIERASKGDALRGRARWGELARRHFAMLESWLDRATIGPTWLKEARVADLVANALHYRDGKTYRLDAYSIMPNHVHSVFAPLARNDLPTPLSSIMHSLKRNTARRANLVLDRSGALGTRKLRSLHPKSN
jgi:hypothetical protein